MPLPQTTGIPDAAESNAGDNYHLVYAVRKSLELLNFSEDGLKALSLEGLVRSDEATLESKSLLGVDMTEYYGGHTLPTAKKVVISQLKYSTRHATKPWTAAELCQGKKKGSAGSVIDRLGQLYRDLVKTKPADKNKLVVKLVSNRPVAADLGKLITDLNALQDKQKKTISIGVYADNVIVKRFASASKIPITDIIDFLLALDFSDCGSGTSLYQKSRSYEAISKLGNLEGRTQFAKLKELVGDRMLPENKIRNTLVKEDILYEFGFNELNDLLPVSNKINVPVKVIAREQLTALANLITDPSVTVACLHGHAGIGKSTLMNEIPGRLPVGSQAFIYDCYGGGAYNDSEDRRHRPDYAFLQLSNELALRCNTSFLLVRNGETGQLLKEFKKRLTDAVSVTRSEHPDALIVLLIDAADNSVSAARHFQSDCFVADLSRLGLPDGCKVIFSARTERVATLNLTETAIQIGIDPFSIDETKEFLANYYGDAEEASAFDFHKLTYGIPRVMSYVLDNPGNTLGEKTAFLLPKGKTLDQIFNQRITEARKRSGDPAAINKFLSSLVALPNPVPEVFLARISGLSQDMLTDLRTDLWHGLVYDNGNYLFRDEDFETYIRTKYKTDLIQYRTIAAILLENAETSDYASIHLGSFLYHAGTREELTGMVIQKKYLTLPADPIKNKEVFIERVRLAMRLSDKAGLDFFKLQFIAAEAAKSNELIENILREHAELAAAYGDLQTNQKLYFQSGNPHWFGPAHFRNAAIFSRSKATYNLAREHLNNANSWLNYRHHLTEEQRRDYEFTAKDVAYGAEAILRMFGVKRCAAFIESWTPRSFGFDIFEELLKQLVSQETNQQLNRWLKSFNLRADLRVAAVNIFFRYGLKVGFRWRDIKRLPLKISLSFQEKLIGFLEFAFANGWSYDEGEPLLKLIKLSYPNHLPGFYYTIGGDSDVTELDLLFRVKAISKHLKGDSFLLVDLYSESMRNSLASEDDKVKRKYTEEKAKLDRLYKHLLRVYDCRAGFLLRKTTEKGFNIELKESIKQIGSDWELRHYHDYQYQRIYTFITQKLMDGVFFTKKYDALNIITGSLDDRKVHNIGARLKIAARLSQRTTYNDFVLRLLQGVEASIKDELLPGSEIMDYYTQATIIASRIAREEGKYYFDQLVLASAEIDEEAYDQIRCIEIISRTENFRDPELAFNFARYVEYCSVKLGDGRHFPWEEAITAISALDTASLWAINCRWDHRNIRKQKEHLTDITELSLNAGLIGHATAAALMLVNPYFEYGAKKMFGPVIASADSAADKKFKDLFVRDYLHDLQLYGSPKMDFAFAADAFELLKEGRFTDRELLKEFKQYLDVITELSGPLKEKTQKDQRKKNHSPSAAVKKYLKNIKVDKELNIQSLIVSIRQKTGNRNDYFLAADVFRELRIKAKPGNEQHYLDALSELNDENISYFDFEQAIEETILEWEHLAVLKTWRKSAFGNIIINWFSNLAAYRSLDYKSLKKLQRLFNATDEEVAAAINGYFPEHLDTLPAGILYNLFQISITGLSSADRRQLIGWVLSRWSEPLKPDFGDGVFSERLLPPIDVKESISSFFQYNLGHPVRALRWRAAHSLRRMVGYGQTWVVETLLVNSNRRTIGAFQDGKNIFFWMSSRLYLFIALEKIVKDHPASMRLFAPQLLQQLNNNDLPHTQIKFFLRSACIYLNDLYEGLYTSVEQNQIRTSLSPVKRIVKTTGNLRPQRRGNLAKDEVRFHFDQTDTVPYWYDGLADVFDIETQELIRAIDKLISEDWGFTGDPHKIDHVLSDYTKTQNRHGDEPRVENLQTYFEYHGMFCAAYNFLKRKGAQKRSARASWEAWIEDWGLAWPNEWLGDLRDPIPLEKRFWELKNPDNEWEYSVQPEDFHERTGTIPASSTVTLEEDSYVYFGKDHERVKIETGLVHPETAPALLAALQNELGYDSYIPHNGAFAEDLEDSLKTLDKKFLTESLIKVLDNDHAGIDDRDPLFNDYLKQRIVRSAMLKRVLDKLDAEETKFEVWNNTVSDRHYDGFTTSGHRFTIRKKSLLELLNKRNRCLVITCNISRDLDRAKHDEYLPDNCLVYLIYPNGIAYTITGHHQIR